MVCVRNDGFYLEKKRLAKKLQRRCDHQLRSTTMNIDPSISVGNEMEMCSQVGEVQPNVWYNSV